MKLAVLLTDSNINYYIYGVKFIEGEYLSMYDVQDAALYIVKEIFPEAQDVELEWGQKINLTLGGAAPYRTTLFFKSATAF